MASFTVGCHDCSISPVLTRNLALQVSKSKMYFRYKIISHELMVCCTHENDTKIKNHIIRRIACTLSSAGTNVKDSNIRPLSIFSTNVLSYQTFVAMINIVKM